MMSALPPPYLNGYKTNPKTEISNQNTENRHTHADQQQQHPKVHRRRAARRLGRMHREVDENAQHSAFKRRHAAAIDELDTAKRDALYMLLSTGRLILRNHLHL
jgi:hypothetical protein